MAEQKQKKNEELDSFYNSLSIITERTLSKELEKLVETLKSWEKAPISLEQLEHLQNEIIRVLKTKKNLEEIKEEIGKLKDPVFWTMNS